MTERDIQEKLNEMKKVKSRKRVVPEISKPKYKAPWKARRVINIANTKLAKYQTTKLFIPYAEKNHSTRSDMFLSQLSNMVMPIKGEIPSLLSTFEGDMIGRSTPIHRGRGKITLLHVFEYTTRKIYLYKYNDTIDIFDTTGLLNYNGLGTLIQTDLSKLEIGVEYDISSDDDNFIIDAPIQYDPVVDYMPYGTNVNIIYSTKKDTPDDSCSISTRLIDKLKTIKIKQININLNNKTIVSPYKELFPNLREIIQEPITLKVVELADEEDTAGVFQDSQTPVGLEDEQIMVVPNSFINYIEVVSNEPMTDPILEKHRQEYLDFRSEFVSYVMQHCLSERSKWSDKLVAYYEDFKISKFRLSSKTLSAPRIKLEMVEISRMSIGSKMSSRTGSKATISNIYEAGTLVDELGREIDMEFSVSAHIARLIAGNLVEQDISGMMMFLKLIISGELKEFRGKPLDKTLAIKTVRDVLDIYDLKHQHIDFTDQELEDIFTKHDYIPLSIIPYENNINMITGVQAYKLMKDRFGYDSMHIYRKDKDGNVISKLSSKHTVGSIYMFRDVHDSDYSSSSMGTMNRTTKGTPEEKNKSRHEGVSLFVKKGVKIDVQQSSHHYGTISDQDLYQMVVSETGNLYIVEEMAVGMGMKIGWEVDENE